ncbi:dipeptide transporter ATP-binding subunit [compost metagenome]
MSSIPKMARKAERVRLSPIKGTVPAPRDRPDGCAFTSRCPYAFEPCATVRPERTEVGNGHHARCHLLTRRPVEAVA